MSLFRGANSMIDAYVVNSQNQLRVSGEKKKSVSWSMCVHVLTVSILLITGSIGASAFTQVIVSTAAPIGTESAFLIAMQQQFNVKVVSNPLAANTYAVTLYGLNPNYQAPTPPPTNLQEALLLGATVYVYGFANGMQYQQTMEEGLVQGYAVLCSMPSQFNLNATTANTFDLATCEDTLGTINRSLFEQSLSTPTVIPGVP